MRDFQKGKIYKIVCRTTGKQYVGSTTTTLQKRLGQHKTDYIRHCILKDNSTRGHTTSVEIIAENNYYIELLEKCICNNERELFIREAYYINNIECININKMPNLAKLNDVVKPIVQVK